MKKVLFYLWSLRHELSKYVIVGVVGVVLDLVTLIFFKEKLGLTPVIAVVCNQAVVLSFNFNLNKFWSFKNKAMPHKQILRFLVVMLGNYVYSIGVMYVFTSYFGFDYRIVRVVTIASTVPVNFFLYKYWVYKS